MRTDSVSTIAYNMLLVIEIIVSYPTIMFSKIKIVYELKHRRDQNDRREAKRRYIYIYIYIYI